MQDDIAGLQDFVVCCGCGCGFRDFEFSVSARDLKGRLGCGHCGDWIFGIEGKDDSGWGGNNELAFAVFILCVL